jgi:hypothetical protein
MTSIHWFTNSMDLLRNSMMPANAMHASCDCELCRACLVCYQAAVRPLFLRLCSLYATTNCSCCHCSLC